MTPWASWLFTVVALLSAVPQFLQYAGHVKRGDFAGSAYAPRVEAVLKASTATLEGGPFATIPVKDGYSVAPGLINDLGIAAAISAWTHYTGRQATWRTLGWLNLLIMIGACVFLVFALPPILRLWLVPLFLLVPLIVPLYRNVDSVAIHGSLALLSVAIALVTLRAPPPWIALGCGFVLFLVHKTRSVYAIYSLLALLPGVVVAWRGFRYRRPLTSAAVLALGFTICEVPWRVAVASRSSDPRVVEKDSLPEHNTYEALISGIGWTNNPWGIKPYDPWVAQFLADTVHGDVVGIASVEGERRARLVYFSLVKQRPFALAWLYIRRIPKALVDYSILGAKGAIAWLLVAGLAIVLAMRRRDREGLLVVLPPIGVAGGLILQTILIDTRYIYAHPLELISAVVLVTAIPVALRNARS